MIVRVKQVALENKGWSVYRLAREMDLPQQTVYSWATGRTQPSYSNMDRLCEILGCGTGDLFVPEAARQLQLKIQ